MINEFSSEVIEEINYYVYRLIDPRNGNTFYIGKGQGNRVFDHMRGALKRFEEDEDELSEKIGTINQILQSGLEIIHVIHRHGLDNVTAHEVEAALIDAFPGLSNSAGGRGSRERGPKNALEIQRIYGTETIENIAEKCIIIKLKQDSIDRFTGEMEYSDAIYEATRFAWTMSITKARKAKLVLSTLDGIVKAVYSDMKWHECEVKNGEKKRIYFDGRTADNKIAEKYIEKRIPSRFRGKEGGSLPFRYTWTKAGTK